MLHAGRRPDITPEQAGALAATFKALADPPRVRIVNLLANAAEPVCVCDFMPQLDLAQGAVSFHHKKLLDAGLLDREQRGTWAYYSLRRDALDRLSAIFQKGLRAAGFTDISITSTHESMPGIHSAIVKATKAADERPPRQDPATGMALVAVIVAVGPVSGAHLNPAVTPLDRVFTGVSSVAAAVYLAAQVAGAVLANLMFGLPAVTTSTPCAHRA